MNQVKSKMVRPVKKSSNRPRKKVKLTEQVNYDDVNYALSSDLDRLFEMVSKINTDLRRQMRENNTLPKRGGANNHCVLWYNNLRQDFNCHILGSKVSGNSILEVLQKSSRILCSEWNTNNKTKFSHIYEIKQEEVHKKWTKAKLIEEYSKLLKQIK